MKKIDMHIHPKFPAADITGVLHYMDNHQVETAMALGSTRGEWVNENILRLRQLAADRIIGAPHLDPRETGALDKLQHYYDHGCRMVKLFPNFGYYPDDPAWLPFFTKVADLGCGVISHCGWLGTKLVCSTKFARPGRFEELFRRFPRIPFIMAHMGGIDGFLEGIMYTTRTPNVYLDTTPGQAYWIFRHAGDLVRGMPPERLLMGTDGVMPESDGSDYTDIYNYIMELGWEEHLVDIFHDNALRLIAEYSLLPA